VFPASLELAAGDASEFRVSILPEKDGIQQITIKVKEGSTVIKQDTYGVTVSKAVPEEESSVDRVNSVLNSTNKRNILLALVGVLALALIIAVVAGTRPRY
jgi:predicted nucleic acid-binding Zn ribbon protein